jgi:hypothetical protein
MSIAIACVVTAQQSEGELIMKDIILPRRTVLRAGLVMGCSVWMPIALPDENPKLVSDNPDSTSAARKVSQTSVQYQVRPKGEQKCASCMNFISESNTCKMVEGTVNPDGWCNLWAKIA